jgi:hypothetical protein
MSVTFFSFFVLYMFDMWLSLWGADKTKISFLILAIWLVSSISVLGYILKPTMFTLDVLWFSSESLVTLGLIGTVCGFLMMLFSAFTDIDVKSTESLTEALTYMAVGMSTALSTTLVGLITSLHLKTQLVLIETGKHDKEQSQI